MKRRSRGKSNAKTRILDVRATLFDIKSVEILMKSWSVNGKWSWCQFLINFGYRGASAGTDFRQISVMTPYCRSNSMLPCRWMRLQRSNPMPPCRWIRPKRSNSMHAWWPSVPRVSTSAIHRSTTIMTIAQHPLREKIPLLTFLSSMIFIEKSHMII